ncbi:MAG: hypothetical protein QOK40_3174 [Miltoncostaeaceae bacterium]|jgi:hypothetical protein|nr:hypothetical protein [Miltoncostaeaceae bacterium]
MEMQRATPTTTHVAVLIGGPADGLSFPIPTPSHRCVTLVHPSHPDRIHHYHLEGDAGNYHYFDTVRVAELRSDD